MYEIVSNDLEIVTEPFRNLMMVTCVTIQVYFKAHPKKYDTDGCTCLFLYTHIQIACIQHHTHMKSPTVRHWNIWHTFAIVSRLLYMSSICIGSFNTSFNRLYPFTTNPFDSYKEPWNHLQVLVFQTYFVWYLHADKQG